MFDFSMFSITVGKYLKIWPINILEIYHCVGTRTEERAQRVSQIPGPGLIFESNAPVLPGRGW